MSKLTDFELHALYSKAFRDKSAEGIVTACVAALRAIEAAATEPLLQRIAELERQLEESRKQMEAQKDEWLAWEAKRKALEKDAERWHEMSARLEELCNAFKDAPDVPALAMQKGQS